MDWVRDLLQVVGPLGGVWLGAILGHGSQRTQKLLDLRRPAYGLILAQLAKVEARLNWISELISEAGDGYFQDPQAHMSHDRYIGDEMQIAQQRFVDDYLILSDQFVSRFEKMQADISSAEYEIPPIAHDIFETAVRSARPDLLAIARREVAGRSFWFGIRPGQRMKG